MSSAPVTIDTDPPRTMASALADSLRDDIIKGVHAPGAKLAIKELCQRYDAGAIPMREALSRLATSGLVVAQDQRGFRVADVSRAELEDITDARIHIECEALRRSITRGSLDWEERLVGAQHRLLRLSMLTGDGNIDAAWESAHDAFHIALISGCGSHWLVDLARMLRDQTARYRYLSIAPGGEPPESKRDVTAEHRAMAEAALARDADQACALLAEHLQATTRLVLSNALRA